MGIEQPMKIKLTTLYVDDQDKALRFYTEVLGFVKKADVSKGPFRWLTVASAEDPDGGDLPVVEELARDGPGDPCGESHRDRREDDPDDFE